MATIPQSPSTDFTSTTLNGTINDSVLTITVNDASKIVVPCYAVIDREDNNGNATPNQREVVYISAKSGNDLTVVRGVDNSTARSHNDSAKFEPLITVGFWDDFYDAYDLDHNPADGSHDITRVAMLSGATVQTLTSKILSSPTIAFGSLTTTYISNATIVDFTISNSAHASGASLVGFFPSGASGSVLTSIGNSSTPVFAASAAAGLSSKIITFTRDLTAVGAPTNVSYTGVGFTPTAIHFIWAIIGNDSSAGEGFVDSTKNGYSIYKNGATSNTSANLAIAIVTTGDGTDQYATVASFDADGFTLTWTKEGSPTGTANIHALCFR